MKLLKRYINLRDATGTVSLVAEDAEDMWHIYNLVGIGDHVRTTAQRKIKNESATGSTSSQRVTTTLTVEVENIDYDSVASVLHLKGKNVEENQHVKLGAYHTLDLTLQLKFTLTKHNWDSMHTYRLDLACDPAQRADLAAIVMHEGLANVCLITPSMTICKAKIDVSIPRKRKEFTGQHDKAILKFFDQVCAAVLRHIDLSIVKCVLIASPGFVRDAFYAHLFEWAAANGHRALTEARPKFVVVHSSSGFKHALNEVLADPAVTARLVDTKAQLEVRALAHFHQLLGEDPDRAFYGYRHVMKALGEKAIDTLLLSDHLFMSKDVEVRRKYVRLVEAVRVQGATVHIFRCECVRAQRTRVYYCSVRHVSGEQLKLLSGVAAILRYPLHDLLSDDDDDEDDV